MFSSSIKQHDTIERLNHLHSTSSGVSTNTKGLYKFEKDNHSEQ